MAKLFWLEAVLPLGIIAGMLRVMGNAQYFIHRAAHGRPKHIGNDIWDVAMERRDKKIMEHHSAPANLLRKQTLLRCFSSMLIMALRAWHGPSWLFISESSFLFFLSFGYKILIEFDTTNVLSV